MRAPDEAHGVLTLGALLTRLAPVVVDLHLAPRGLDAPVGRVLLAGVNEHASVHTADLVVMVGAGADGGHGRAVAEAVVRCAESGACGVVLKEDALDAATSELAAAHGLAVLTASADADWGQVFTLLRSAAAAGAVGSVDQGPADLFALADAIAGAVGGATTIEDRQLRVVAYSNLDHPIDRVRRDSILGRSVPPYVLERDDIVRTYQRMWTDTDIVRLPHDADEHVRGRMGASVRAGDEVIGTIWVVEGDRPFDEAAERALRESTPVVALQLLRHHAADDVERRRREDAARRVVEGRGAPADLVGAGPAAVVAFGSIDDARADAAAGIARRRRLLDVVTYQLELHDARGGAVPTDDGVLALVPAPASPGGRLREAMAEIARRASHALKSTVVVGIGGVFRTEHADAVAALAASRWEAEQAAAVAAAGTPGSPTVRTIDDVRSQVVMRCVADLVRSDPRTRTPQWHALAQHDDEHHTQHVATLGAFLDAFGDVSAAATALDIHPNTMRYRLKRIAEIVDVDLTDPTERFVLELQWRVR